MKDNFSPIQGWYKGFLESLQEPEGLKQFEEASLKDVKDIKASLNLTQDYTGVEVHAIAVANDDSVIADNILHYISCKRGKPLSHCCYNVASDCYIVYAVDFVYLGQVPISYQLNVAGAYEFVVDIPLPEKVLLRYLEEAGLETLKEFRKMYPKENFKIEFVQMLKVSRDD